MAAFARNRETSALTQLAGTKACVSLDGTDGSCAVGVGLRNSTGIAISPNDRNVYVAARGDGAIAVFKRNGRTGALTQLSGSAACLGDGGCQAAIGLGGAEDVVVSPDGRHVYVASRDRDAVAAFKRNRRTGALAQLSGSAACISEGGVGGCAAGVGLKTAHAIAISPDGKNVYVGSRDGRAVAVFARNSDTGALTQLAGTDACVSADGGVCATGIALDPVSNVTVSPDGKHVYVASRSSNGVAVFARDETSGALTQLSGSAACISEHGPAECTSAVGLGQAADVVISPDNKHAYVAVTYSDGVAAFDRALP